MKTIVWNFAGSDSSGAAGAQTDLKTINAHGCHASQVITALTAQTPASCLSVFPVPLHQVGDQIAALKKGPAPKAVKIGMIGDTGILNLIRSELGNMDIPVVLDPVLNSSSGPSLSGNLDPDELLSLGKANNLFITPNIPEAVRLSGVDIKQYDDLPVAADILLEKGAKHVLIKGGHLEHAAHGQDDLAVDYYADRSGLSFYLKSSRSSVNLRGTGCTLASAIASNLAEGYEPQDAVVLAKAYLNQCLATHIAVSEQISIADHQKQIFKPEFMPSVIPGRKYNQEEFRPSPVHRTGFYVIADSADWITSLSDWRVPTLQLRIKNLSEKQRRPEIEKAIAAARTSQSALYINDYWLEAIEAGAFGVHLGQEDLESADISAIKAAGLHLGISTHSWYEAAVAHHYKPSYIALGPIFPTTCKSMRFGPQGFVKLAQWKLAWPYPVVAIGGLTTGHTQALTDLDADGAAVISDVIKSADPETRVAEWLSAFPGERETGTSHDDRIC